MGINKLMRATLKVLSYDDTNLIKNYKVERIINNITHPSIKFLHKQSDIILAANNTFIRVRVFEPKKIKSSEILLFFHGGGWVSGSIDSYTLTCATLSKQTGRVVMSVEYRLAPEFPFPTAILDCYAVTKHFINKYGEKNIILIGDSAGANLAAVVSLMARDKNEFNIKAQILLYPSTYNNHSSSSPFKSIIENGTDYLLTSKKICDYMKLYASCSDDYLSPYFAPLISDDLSNQPETLIITAEFDPLRDEGEAYGQKLLLFKNRVKIYRMNNALHGFFSLPIKFKSAKKSYSVINTFLNEVNDR